MFPVLIGISPIIRGVDFMKKNLILIFCAASAVLSSFVGCATTQKESRMESEKTTETKQSDSTAKKTQAASQYINVDLKSNPTTGGGWKVEIEDESVAKVESHTYEPDENDSNLVGVGGVESIGIKCLKSGRTNIKFIYGQMWEGGNIWETRTAEIIVNENKQGIINFQ